MPVCPGGLTAVMRVHGETHRIWFGRSLTVHVPANITLSDIASSYGTKYFTTAFVDGSNCQWNITAQYTEPFTTILNTDLSVIKRLPTHDDYGDARPRRDGLPTHAMTPTLGRGANVAMRDGALLGRHLKQVAAGQLPLVQALAAYERDMTAYGFSVVREAAHVGEQRMAQNPLPA